MKKKTMKSSNGKVKKVLSHLKEDKKEFREHIKDDNKLMKSLKKGKKKSTTPP